MWLPKADGRDKIVERAEWLLANHPPRWRYNLIGNNREHAANFCVAEYTESLQVRRFEVRLARFNAREAERAQIEASFDDSFISS